MAAVFTLLLKDLSPLRSIGQAENRDLVERIRIQG